MLKEINLPQLNAIMAELDEVKVEKHGEGQNDPDYDFTGAGTQLIKLFYSAEEKAEIEGYYNTYNEMEGQNLSAFILSTLRICKKLKK